jgi:hypothetical protein
MAANAISASESTGEHTSNLTLFPASMNSSVTFTEWYLQQQQQQQRN